MSKQIISQSRLKELLNYDSGTGTFIWKKSGTGRRKSLIAGNIGDQGYLSINIDKQHYKAHRLAFLYMDGVFPPDEVDHIDNIRHHNKWENLRYSTKSENMRNKLVARHNTSGVTGVSWSKGSNKWAAYMNHNGSRIYSKHDDWFEAVCFRKSLEIQYGF